jgi:LysR family transcriptional regulator, glycine cleavage system transcriptional activator
MSRNLPPLSAVRVFEAAARHLSFTRAAAELGMTQAAVSYQIKVLEARVGAPLFLRGKRKLTLSEAGQRMAGPSTEALDLVAAGFDAARGHAVGVLSMSVVPTFAAGWLARHLGEFQMAHPDVAVRLGISTDIVGFDSAGVDVAIRGGRLVEDPDLDSFKLLDAGFTPMMSPELIERMGGLESPADLLRYPLISPSDPWWDLWFAKAGVERAPPGREQAWGLGTQHLESLAAIAGNGVAVLTPFFYREEVAAGRLVQPFDLVCRDAFAYRLCYPRSRRNSPKIRAFRDWLVGRFPDGEA